MRAVRIAFVFSLLIPAAAAAQSDGGGSGLAASCASLPVEFSADTRDFCYTVAQAVESAQPQVGIAVVGGNVTPASATSGGLRLGAIPILTVTGKVNFVMARYPNVASSGAGAGRTTGEKSIPAPAVQGTAAFELFSGANVAPGLSGFGAVDLLGSVTWLPIKASQLHGFGENTATTAYGVGGRLGLLKESFRTPGVSVSVMYHSLGQVSYGNVCETTAAPTGSSGDAPQTQTGVCVGDGDPGEFAFDLKDWSTRAQVSKKLALVGLAAGVGYDSWSSDTNYGLRGSCLETSACFVRVTNAELDTGRWSAFADASLGGILGSLVAEVGWLQGADPITGFSSAVNEFDPKKGTLFGSIGLKLTL
jgi:hypothetical protein